MSALIKNSQKAELSLDLQLNGNFSLLYVMKISLRRTWLVLKSLKTPLRNIKRVPN